MIEHDLTALADRIAPEVAPDLADRVLARLDQASAEATRRRSRRWIAAVATAATAGSFLSPQVRTFAADLIGIDGIAFVTDAPDAPSEPLAPLPDVRELSVADARAAVDFPVVVPARLGEPDRVEVADDGRVVTLFWRHGVVGALVLDQFDGSLGPVFSKHVGGVAAAEARVGDATAYWIPEPHDLVYVDRDGNEVTSTARLSGPSLVWEADGVTLRLEGERLSRTEAVAIGRSLH